MWLPYWEILGSRELSIFDPRIQNFAENPFRYLRNWMYFPCMTNGMHALPFQSYTRSLANKSSLKWNVLDDGYWIIICSVFNIATSLTQRTDYVTQNTWLDKYTPQALCNCFHKNKSVIRSICSSTSRISPKIFVCPHRDKWY